MKVLVDAVPMSGLLTGIARYLRNLYTAMAGLDRADLLYFDGRTVSREMPPLADAARWQKATAAVRNLPDPLVFGLRAARWMKHEYLVNRACRFHCPGLYHETAFTPARLTRVPTVFSMYDLSLRRYRQTQPRERVWMFEYFIRTRLKYARHVLTISEFIRQEIIDEFGIDPSRVTAVPLAPDPVFSPCKRSRTDAVRKAYGLPKEYLLFVSSLEPRKNIDTLVRALPDLASDIPLVLVGWQGWGEKAWIKKIGSRRLANRVYFTGHIPDRDLRAVYAGATALVYPSLYEGFGLPIVEAMACGCPVICSRAASMPEVAGDAAVLADPRDSEALAAAIDRVVSDSGFRQRLIRRGKDRAASFTWERTAAKTLDLFKEVAR